MFLTRDQILSKTQFNEMPSEEVPVPQWGGKVIIRGLSVGERDAYEESLFIGKGRKRQLSLRDARAKLLVQSIVDKDGRQMFDDEEVSIITKWPALIASPLFDAAQRLSGISDDDLDELVKNSETTPIDDSDSS